MRQWYAIFEGEQRESEIEEVGFGPLAFERFDAAVQAGAIDGRKVIGMWIIDQYTEQADVIRCYGRIPGDILQRFRAWQEFRNQS